MHGGISIGKFFVSEVDRIEEQHQSRLPKSAYTPEEIEAGFQRMARAFGIPGTVFYLQSIPPYRKSEEIYRMSTYEVYFWLEYLAHDGDTKKKYGDVMSRKTAVKKRKWEGKI